MGYNCAACTKYIRASQQIQCSKCSCYYHHICVNLADAKNLSEEIKSIWACPMCIAVVPRRDKTNSLAAARASATCSVGPVTAVQHEVSRKISASAPASPLLSIADSNSLSTLASEMRLLREDVGEIKSQMKSLTDHITKCNARLDEHEKNLSQAVERLHVVEERTSIIISLENTISVLREQQKSRAQAFLRNEVEIAGINENPNENPRHMIRVIAQKIGAPLEDRDLDYVTRVGPQRRDEGGSSTEEAVEKLPRPLVVRFLRRYQRDEFLKAGKVNRNLNCADIEVSGARRNIYFNERLTQENRQLFRSARFRCKGSGFKYCWIKNGSVYVRRHEGNPAIAIKNMDELHRVVQSSPPE